MKARRDEARSTKPVRIPSLPPPTAPLAVVRGTVSEADEDSGAGDGSADGH